MSEYHTFVDFVLNTKLMEYAVAFLFIGLFAIFYKVLQAPPSAVTAKETVAGKAFDLIRGLLVPDGLGYHQGHTWARLESAGTATVGMDDFAAKLVGDVERVKLPAVGTTLSQGEKAWTLMVDGKPVDMISPVDGTVVAINEEQSQGAQGLGEDPYGRGWLLKVESPKVNRSFKNLLSGLLARQWTEQSVEKLFARANPELGLVAGDGGLPFNGMARQLDEEHWDQIAREFFLSEG